MFSVFPMHVLPLTCPKHILHITIYVHHQHCTSKHGAPDHDLTLDQQ